MADTESSIEMCRFQSGSIMIAIDQLANDCGFELLFAHEGASMFFTFETLKHIFRVFEDRSNKDTPQIDVETKDGGVCFIDYVLAEDEPELIYRMIFGYMDHQDPDERKFQSYHFLSEQEEKDFNEVAKLASSFIEGTL